MNLFLYWINENGGNSLRFQLLVTFQSFSVGLERKELEPLEQESKKHNSKICVLCCPSKRELKFTEFIKDLGFGFCFLALDVCTIEMST